jgi:MoaA/NifB/PqqE/SkfB family radical SAM enzyme
MAGKNLEVKESAVKEKRIWVRLTRRCNNGCLFCLDSDSHDGTAISAEAVEQRIREGREEGGQRLILSGGEPTIHPLFIDFLRLGRKLGYDWLQTVTNGRMFAYRKFATSALSSGLNEATFSMHGHNPELHDYLVGVKGAYEQAMAGMRNLLGRCVVNVDVVLSAVNIPHLREILEFYIDLGIHEFDLLHMIPFGRAWNDYREVLFYDPEEMMPHFERAFSLRHEKGVIIWTNRLPAPFLEGNEDLIQDPHKLHDEVRGRAEMFREWEVDGVDPICLDPDRCSHCPMERFCGALEEEIGSGGSASVAPAPETRFATLEDVSSEDIGEAAKNGRIYLPASPGIGKVLGALEGDTLSQVRLYMLRHEYLSEAVQLDLPLDDLHATQKRFGVLLEGLPVCLGGQPDDARDAQPAEVRDDSGQIDYVSFTDWFVANRYFVKSLRCGRCIHLKNCRGIHINTARNWGLGVLRPITQPEPAPTSD